MFIIFAIIIVSALVVLKTVIKIPAAIEEKRVLEGTLEDKLFTNIKNELQRALEFSTHEEENITKNVFDFANFTRDEVTEHRLVFKLLYVGILANRTTQKMNITLVNLLNNQTTVNLTISNTSWATVLTNCNNVAVADWGTCANNSLDFTEGTSYTLNVTYGSNSRDVGIKTKTNRNVYVGFFDITLESTEATHRNRFQVNYTLPK